MQRFVSSCPGLWRLAQGRPQPLIFVTRRRLRTQKPPPRPLRLRPTQRWRDPPTRALASESAHLANHSFPLKKLFLLKGSYTFEILWDKSISCMTVLTNMALAPKVMRVYSEPNVSGHCLGTQIHVTLNNVLHSGGGNMSFYSHRTTESHELMQLPNTLMGHQSGRLQQSKEISSTGFDVINTCL
jgi:hypothetical protein